MGAETLELVAGLPLLAMAMMVAWQGVALMRQQAEVEADARLLARAAVVCGASTPSQSLLATLDPEVSGAQIESGFDARTKMHTVALTVPARSVTSWVNVTSLSGYRPHARAVMHAEPC